MIKKIRAGAGICLGIFKSRLNCVIALSVVTALLLSFLGLSINNVSIKAGEEKTVNLKTLLSDTDSILDLADISYSRNDKITTIAARNRLDIAVQYSFPVYVTLGNTTSTVMTTSGTVGDILTLAGIEVGENDIVNYSLDTIISATSYIDVVDIDYITETYKEAINYRTKTIYSSSYPKGTRFVTGGQNGEKQVTCINTVVNGSITNREIISETVLSTPVDQVTTIGTKSTTVKSAISDTPATMTSANVSAISTMTPSSPIELDANGNPVNYSKHISVTATAYVAKGTCATGVRCIPGCIAVNPNYIPYGTRLYIKSSDGKYVYGYAVAADTGGFASKNPTQVDLAFPSNSDCIQFGRRSVEIYILD